MRRVTAFACDGDRLFGTVDEGSGTTGVLIVSGGNEVRCGAHRGMAMLAQRLADTGVPAFRFDRRGVGDSEGENRGYASSAPDIAAALAAFRQEQPQLRRVIGFGNCDAATALLLFDRGCDALVLANPWLGDEDASLPPAALRRHFARRLFSLTGWRRLLSGDILGKVGEWVGAFRKGADQPLAAQVTATLAARSAALVLARGDRTAQVFAASVRVPSGMRVVRIDTASHSFAGDDETLAQVVIDAAASSGDKKVGPQPRPHPIATGFVEPERRVR